MLRLRQRGGAQLQVQVRVGAATAARLGVPVGTTIDYGTVAGVVAPQRRRRFTLRKRGV